MKITRRNLLVLVSGIVAAGAVTPSFAAGTVVNVSLWDKGPNSMDMLGEGKMMGFGMGMMAGKMKNEMMGISLDVQEVAAGDVTFEAVNNSKDFVHEMIIIPAPASGKPLPYNKDMERVEEETAGSLGEVSELDPGKKGALRVELKPGKYILLCNVPGHYALGMWTVINVTG